MDALFGGAAKRDEHLLTRAIEHTRDLESQISELQEELRRVTEGDDENTGLQNEHMALKANYRKVAEQRDAMRQALRKFEPLERDARVRTRCFCVLCAAAAAAALLALPVVLFVMCATVPGIRPGGVEWSALAAAAALLGLVLLLVALLLQRRLHAQQISHLLGSVEAGLGAEEASALLAETGGLFSGRGRLNDDAASGGTRANPPNMPVPQPLAPPQALPKPNSSSSSSSSKASNRKSASPPSPQKSALKGSNGASPERRPSVKGFILPDGEKLDACIREPSDTVEETPAPAPAAAAPAPDSNPHHVHGAVFV